MNSLRLGFILFIVCFFSAFLLSFFYAKTKPIIEKRKKEDEYRLKKEILPEANEFKKINKEIEIGYKDGQPIGKIIHLSKKGYSSMIELLIGINNLNRITEIKILSQNETPGLGSKITSPKFLNQFKNQTEELKIDSITGATISSKAVIEGVKEAFAKWVY